MPATEAKPLMDTERARAIWDEYEQTHDIRHLQGQAVGVDLETGELYFGECLLDIDNQLRAAGRFPRSLYLTRAGLGYYEQPRPRKIWQPAD